MKHLKSLLRIWIAFCSLVGFFAGWVMLAHSPKPVQAAQSAVFGQSSTGGQAGQLAPLPPMPNFSQAGSNFQPVPFQPQTSFALPRLRTGGS
jgi:hypothetical protein